MSELNSEEYQKVLLYMQSVSEDDFQVATQALRITDFDLQKAIQLARFKTEARNPLISDQNKIMQNTDEAIVRKYIQHALSKNQKWSLFASFLKNCKMIFSGFFKIIGEIILPQSLVLRFLRSQFYQLYYKSIRLSYKQQQLIKVLQNTKNIHQRSVLVAISNRQTHQIFVDLFNRPEIIDNIDNHFHFSGYMLDDKSLDLLQGEKFAPQIIICRMNIFDEILIIKRFRGDQLRHITPEFLTKCYKQGVNMYKGDQNVIIKYRNYINKVYGYNVVEQEEEQVDCVDLQRDTEEIRRQNQTYRQIQEVHWQKFYQEKVQQIKARQELKQIEQNEELRKIRKMSLPQEPVDGQIVRISFRCPDGSTIIRNFATNQKVQLLFTWVQLNQDIMFQDAKKSFQIMYSYPPQQLSPYKQRLLSQIFSQSHQKVLIRQL